MFIKKGFEKRGSDPLNGKGGYVNPKTRRSYYLDKGDTIKKVMSLHTLMSIG